VPVVSVVLPTHNRREMLREALESVARQTLADWEVIVVDDASDPPASLSNGVAIEARRIRLIRHERARGGPAAKNTGIKAAQGEFVAFLDDDDLYQPTYLEAAVSALNAYPAFDVAFMGVAAFGPKAPQSDAVYAHAMRRTMDRAGGRPLAADLVAFDDGLVGALLKSVPMAFQRPIVRRAALDRIGLYREHCFLWDCDWAIRAALVARTMLVDRGLYLQRAGDHGYSSAARRRLDSALSNVEIVETLLQRAQVEPGLVKWRAAFLNAAAVSRLDLALYYRGTGDVPNAWRAWLASQKHVLSPRRFTFLARLAATAVERSVRANEDRARP
jgi:glycosyltransferase involved in cell wall biosynthesis